LVLLLTQYFRFLFALIRVFRGGFFNGRVKGQAVERHAHKREFVEMTEDRPESPILIPLRLLCTPARGYVLPATPTPRYAGTPTRVPRFLLLKFSLFVRHS
jgi:hypothetical protein